MDECEAEIGGALTQAANDALAVVGVVRSGPRIVVHQPILKRAIDEDRELAGRRGDGFGLARPSMTGRYGSRRLPRRPRRGAGGPPRGTVRLTVFGCTPGCSAMSQR